MFPVADVIPSRTRPTVTIAIIALNALAFLFELTLSERELQLFVLNYGVVPAAFSWVSVVTSMFLHGGWLHFLGNMLYLWIFGDNVEDRLGHLPYLLFYLLCGAAAALGQAALQPYSLVPMVGASGAIAGVMGAYFVLFPHSRVITAVFIFFFFDLVEIPAIFFLGIWFFMQFFSGVGSLGSDAAEGGVAFFAHVAGFAVGAIAGVLWRRRASANQRGPWD
ncbi:MAG TPA: rhomboid family intramembrane serine protease [Vicinamibacterales bacterium]|nr:rhomboid family intramembrane serine protease [Vicinamibacterales bacterium]